jgi:hypothetical protein
MNRIEFIESEINKEPNNPLNYYLLALEYRKEGNFTQLEITAEYILEKHSDYQPIYYFYAEHLYGTNREKFGTQIALKGIKLANKDLKYKISNELTQLIEINESN